jgi:hypothetical protein
MKAHLDALSRIADVKTFELQRHRRNMQLLSKVEELLKTYAADLEHTPDAQIVVDPVQAQAKSQAQSTKAKIVNLNAVPKANPGRDIGMTDAIREAIPTMSEVFTTSEIVQYLVNHHPHFKADSSTVSKRLYQLRLSGYIEVLPGQTKGREGARYRLTMQS